MAASEQFVRSLTLVIGEDLGLSCHDTPVASHCAWVQPSWGPRWRRCFGDRVRPHGQLRVHERLTSVAHEVGDAKVISPTTKTVYVLAANGV